MSLDFLQGGVAPFIHTSTTRRLWDFGRQRFFVENGLIHMIDEESGEYKAQSRREFLYKAQMFARSIPREQSRSEKVRLTRLVDAMIECVRIADQQGDPFAPGVMRQLAHDHRSIQVGGYRMPTSVIG